MGRERARIAKRLEKDPVVECNRIQKKFYPEFFSKFEQTKDPRHSSYIEYSNKEMLGTLYYKALAEIESMQAMTREFNEDRIVSNIYRFLRSNEKEYLPHHVTKHWLVLIDGTELDSGYKQKNEHYLERCYNRGTEHEKTKYHRAVLEAKLYLGNGLMVSIGTETIENDDDYIKYKYSEEERKQDCEIKAFKRLVTKIKQAFPRLPICIVADGLYVAESIMDLCESYHWKFIIRYKEGCAKSIEEEYCAIPEKEQFGTVKYVNEIVYKD